MNTPDKQLSRGKAIFAGALAGIAIGVCGAVITGMTIAGKSNSFTDQDLTGLTFALFVLPGSLLIGAIFALPTSATMVFAITALSRKLRFLDSALAWTMAGVLFTSPTAYLFSDLQAGPHRFGLISIWSFLLMLGAIAGFVAWLFRFTKQSEAEGPRQPKHQAPSHASAGDIQNVFSKGS